MARPCQPTPAYECNPTVTRLMKNKLKTIAVIGPNADNPIVILGNYNGMPSEVVTALQGIKTKLGNSVEVVYEKGIPDIHFVGEMSRDITLSGVLKALEASNVHFRLEDNKRLIVLP